MKKYLPIIIAAEVLVLAALIVFAVIGFRQSETPVGMESTAADSTTVTVAEELPMVTLDDTPVIPENTAAGTETTAAKPQSGKTESTEEQKSGNELPFVPVG